MKVRPMRADDIPAILVLQAEIYPDTLLESPAFYRNRLQLAADHCLVGLHGDAVAAYLVSYPWRHGSAPPLDTLLESLPADADTWFVHDCAVSPAGRGLGLAQALWRTAAGQAQRDGLRHTTLVALADAVGFWKRLGYAAAEPALAQRLWAKLAGYGEGACYMGRGLRAG